MIAKNISVLQGASLLHHNRIDTPAHLFIIADLVPQKAACLHASMQSSHNLCRGSHRHRTQMWLLRKCAKETFTAAISDTRVSVLSFPGLKVSKPVPSIVLNVLFIIIPSCLAPSPGRAFRRFRSRSIGALDSPV